MSSFTEKLIVSPLPDGKHWVVRKPFTYYIGEENSDSFVIVPAGFITDFASVPRIFWRLVPRWGKYGTAAVLHDYLYWCQKYTRKRSDEIFLEAMLVLGTKKSTAKNMYRAVRWCGGKSWKLNKSVGMAGKFAILTGEYEEIERVEL